MKRFSKLLCFIVVFIGVMAAFCTVSFAASVGEKLTSPEVGWQRINDNDSHIVYTGMPYYSDSLGSYKNDVHYVNANEFSVKFNFSGTKLRVIGFYNQESFSSMKVKVDGTDYGTLTPSQYSQQQYLLFEVTGLTNTNHSIIISGITNGAWRFQFDAIDIDDTGYLVDINTPVAPTNLDATAGNKEVILKWDSVEGTTSYNLMRSETPGGPYTTTFSAIGTSFSDTNVIPGTTYYYVVSAVINGIEGPQSNEALATIPKSNNKLKLVLEVKEEKQLSVSNDLIDNSDMEWASSDSTLATVDANGMIKALKPGNTVITCTSKDKSYTEIINVLIVDLEYQLAVDLNIGGTCRLTIDDLTNTADVTWTSYDPTIATVSSQGKVTTVSEGLTYIVATDKDGKELGRIYIRVRQ